MPRSFLIANKRYGRSPFNNHLNNQQTSDKHKLNKNDIETNLKTTRSPPPLISVKDKDNKTTTFEDNDDDHCYHKQTNPIDTTQQEEEDKLNDLFNNVKVIINLTPPSTPFQNATTRLDTANNSPSSNEVHICPECGKGYSTSSNLTRHRQTHRSINDKQARKCPHCDKIYVSIPAYSMHIRTHGQGCQCQFCGKCFSRPWLLQGHIRTHTGEKPFQCHICQKAFADKSNLRAHVQTHSMIKPFTCFHCGKSFALKSYLYKHEETFCMQSRLRKELTRFKRKDKQQ